MRSIVRRAAVAAGAIVMVLGTGMGVAAASPGSPMLSWSPDPYDFPAAAVGQVETTTLTLANSGGRASSALTVSLSGSPAFTIPSGTDQCQGIRLGAGGSCTVTVQFTVQASTVTATLEAIPKMKGSDTPTDPLIGETFKFSPLYWTSTTDGTINKASPVGTSPQTLVTGQPNPTGIAVSGGNIYWADNPFGTPGLIMEASLNGTNPHALVAGQNEPEGVAVDSSHIYWADSGNALGNGTIMEADLNGGGVTTLVTGINPVGIAVDSNYIYWADVGTIMRANLNGTPPLTPQTLVTGLNAPAGITVDSSNIIWADNHYGTIMEVGLTGGIPQTLITGQASPIGVAVDSSSIYWANAGGFAIKQANLDGTGVTTLLSFPSSEPNWVSVGPQ